MFYQNTQDTLESGFDKAFTDLNTALVTTINSAFSTFESEYERRLDVNRKAHEEAMSGLNSQFATTTNFFMIIYNIYLVFALSLIGTFDICILTIFLSSINERSFGV